MKTLTRIALLALTTQLLAGCGMGREFIVARDTTETVKVKLGESFTINMEQPVMPYVRSIKSGYDTKIVKFLKTDTTPPPAFSAPGNVGSEFWKFQALQAGTTTLNFEVKNLADEITADRKVVVEVMP